ncbi:MAG: peptidylprolyl isomerase, partial [Caulobacter sp.]|nr:peptidylprolyl isomerase [Vitreoscilla sp.]
MNFKISAALIGTLVLPFAVMAQNVATVNGKPVPMARVDALIKTATHGQEATPEMRQQAKDQVVIREIFAQEAEKQGVAATADYKTQLDLLRQTVLINSLFQNYIKAHPVSDADAQAEYNKIKAEQSGTEYHARHILVDSEDEAKKLIAQIKAGSKFEDVAKKSSKDTGSAENGGDLDWAKPASYVPEFSTAHQGLKMGQMTDTPVKTQFGYHIIRLEDSRTAQFPSYD